MLLSNLLLDSLVHPPGPCWALLRSSAFPPARTMCPRKWPPSSGGACPFLAPASARRVSSCHSLPPPAACVQPCACRRPITTPLVPTPPTPARPPRPRHDLHPLLWSPTWPRRASLHPPPCGATLCVTSPAVLAGTAVGDPRAPVLPTPMCWPSRHCAALALL